MVAFGPAVASARTIRSVTTAWAVLSANRPTRVGSKLAVQSSDAESRARLVTLVDERVGINQVARFWGADRTDSTTASPIRCCWNLAVPETRNIIEILHRVRTGRRGHVVGHQLQILPQRAFRPPRHDPPEPQPAFD